MAEAVRRQLDLLGGLGAFVKRGDTVLLKPNLIAPRSHRHSAAQTHPVVILETAKLLKDFGARPFVADSPAWANVAICARALELIEPLRRLGVPIRELNAPRKCRLVPEGLSVGLSSAALDADVIINLPKFKTHQQLVATFAVKNMFGCVSGKQKALWHLRRGNTTAEFSELLVGVCRYLKPAVTIIDGIVAMHGQGPIRGPSKPLGWLIGGVDPIACELVCCDLVGLGPERLPIVQAARRAGFGCADRERIELVGDDLPITPCAGFEWAQPIPVKFTFGRVCRSMARQFVLLVRGLKPAQDQTAMPTAEQSPNLHSTSGN
ncbi:MAG: DUF362 domain-containing protein [Planctomycetes bacterium]|nr:DUF362 domain-containing protein [Planctomycetota bacterium]